MWQFVTSILLIGRCGWFGRIVCEFVETVLVISLTVVAYFSKRVVNDVIKSEVSTGVGILFWRYCSAGQKSDIESF